MNSRKETLIGVFIGLVGVLIVSMIVSYFQFFKFAPDANIWDFFNFKKYHKMLMPIISLALVFNLGMFYLFLKYDKDNISRGVLASTMLVGVLIFILKFGF